MKKLLLLMVFILLSFQFTGCYTQIWSPDIPLKNYTKSQNNFYPSNEKIISSYYNSTWWEKISYVSSVKNSSPELNNVIDGNGTIIIDYSPTYIPWIPSPTINENGSNHNSNSKENNSSNSNSSSNNNSNQGSKNLRNEDGSRNTNDKRR